MNTRATSSDTLRGWTVIGLRAAEQQGPLRRAAQRQGAEFLSLPALRLRPADDADSARAALKLAIACPACLFTSPAAVRFARSLLDLRTLRGTAIAIGSGTAAALRRSGVSNLQTPSTGMRSEDVLALPLLDPPPKTVGLVTAPGGRGVLNMVLSQRGADVHRAHVYQRLPARLSPRARQAIRQLSMPAALLLSSGEALQHLLAQLDETESSVLKHAWVIAASPRLAELATAAGFARCVASVSTLPADQIAALQAATRAPFFPKSSTFR